MDMGELTRQELDAKLDAIKSWMDARFAEQQARIDVRFAEQDARIEAGFARVDTRFAEQDARMQKNVVDLIKWMVGTAIAMLAVGVAIFAFMLNVAVNTLTLPADNEAGSSGTSAGGGATPAVLLHRLQGHHQSRLAGRDPRRHVLHAAPAQVFHPE
jgi:hypothetical protein